MVYSVKHMAFYRFTPATPAEPVQEKDHRLERLKFHVNTGDYFPMLATILGFLEETVQECKCGLTAEIVPVETKVVRDVRKDLSYLHHNYEIVPKKAKKKGLFFSRTVR